MSNIIKMPITNIEWCSNCQKDVGVLSVDKIIANKVYDGLVCSECQTFIFYKEKDNENQMSKM